MQVTGFYEQGLKYLLVPFNWFAFLNAYVFAWIEGRRFKLVYELIEIISGYTKDKERCIERSTNQLSPPSRRSLFRCLTPLVWVT